MSSSASNARVTPEMRSILAGLRFRIRLYVLLEGLALATIWLIGTFWIALALDYLPILVGASELPQWVRGGILVIVLSVLAYILHRFVLRRLMTRMADRSMAILLERRYRDFGDSLVTAVELSEQPDHAREFSGEMLGQTSKLADEKLTSVKLGQLFRWQPLFARLAIAIALVASLGGFAAFERDAFGIATNRLWALADEPWPRRSLIEVVGIEVVRPAGVVVGEDLPTLVKFENGRLKVARGASFTLRVVAEAGTAVVPETCMIRYRTDDGFRGRVGMNKIGRIRKDSVDGRDRNVQWFAFDGKPFKGILSTVSFDVVGNDHRVGNFTVEVVESPSIVETKLDCNYPEYLVDETLGTGLPRTIDYLPSGTQVPRGTRLTIKARSNKPLQRVVVRDAESDETQVIDLAESGGDGQSFEVPRPGLFKETTTLEFTLLDRDRVFSDRPFKVSLNTYPDAPPKVEARLQGIGTAVTPDVLVPVRGKVSDDYAVDRTSLNLSVGENPTRALPVKLGREGSLTEDLDFREMRGMSGGVALVPQTKMSLQISATDKFKLGDEGPNIGQGELFELDVVTPEELLRMLEARELALRRRFEQTIEEMTEMRDSLLRVKVELATPGGAPARGTEPGDRSATSGLSLPETDSFVQVSDSDFVQAAAPAQSGKDSAEQKSASKEEKPVGKDEKPAEKDEKPAVKEEKPGDAAAAPKDEKRAGAEPGDEATDGLTAAERARSLRILRVQRALQQSQKASQEVLGVALSFLEIREELTNNRVDSEDRKNRLEELIAAPLQKVVAETYPELERRLQALEQQLDNPTQGPAAATATVDQSEILLVQLNEVLQNMLDLETFNELLDIVRDIVKQQGDLIEQTKQQKKKQLLDLTE